MPTSNRRPGDINRNGQRLLAKTTAPGTDHLQKIWNVECAHPAADESICGHRYGLNGSDFHHRKCPKCQGGKPGLPFLEVFYA